MKTGDEYIYIFIGVVGFEKEIHARLDADVALAKRPSPKITPESGDITAEKINISKLI